MLQTTQHMLGPKQFPLDRLKAIFYTIAGVELQPSINIFTQVTFHAVGIVVVVYFSVPLWCQSQQQIVYSV